MAFSVPGREDLFDDFMTDYRGAFPEKNSSRGSDGWRLGRVVSGAAWSIVAKLLFFNKVILPDTADDERLDRWGNIYSFKKKGPAPSQGVQALQVSGTPGSAVNNGDQLSHADGTLYKVASGSTVVGGGGTVVVDVAAISKGQATNKKTGETLTFSAPASGVAAAAVLVKDLSGGYDNEERENYRSRLLDHLGELPQGGALSDYKEWALSIGGVQNAYVYQHRRGLGTIDVAVLQGGSGMARIIADVSPVQAYIDSVRPGGMKDFKILTVTAQTQDVQFDLKADESVYPWDWDDLQLNTYVVTVANAGALQITVPTAPASVIAGKRLTIDGEEATVVSRVGNVLTLSFAPPATWFSSDPTGKAIRASSDLVVPVRNAVLALFDRLGPARSTYAVFPWDDGFRIAKGLAAACDVRGVIDADIALPVANVTPSDPFDLTVPLIIPGKVKVWKMA